MTEAATFTPAQARIAAALEEGYIALRDIDYATRSAARAMSTTAPTLRRALRKMAAAGRARLITDGEGFATWVITANF